MEENRKWFEKPVRVLQFNVEDKYGRYLHNINSKELVDLAEKLHVNVLVIFARDPWGRTFYKSSSVGPFHPKLGEDFIRNLVRYAKEKNIKVVVMIGHTANKYLYLKHSDWAQVNSRGETILLEHVPQYEQNYDPEWPQMCINSPFIEYIAKEVVETISLGVDGVFLDSFRYQPDPERACYCKWCKTRFYKEHGYEMPLNPNWSDSRWRRLWDWRYEVVVDKIKYLSQLAKKLNSDVLFMYNSHPGGWAGRTNRVVEEAREYIDVVYAECSEVDHQPPGFITEMTKLTKAMSGGKPVWSSRNYFHMYRTVQATTPIAVKQGLREAIIAGGSPWLLVFSSTLKQSPEVLEAAKQVFVEHERIEEYLDGAEPIRYAGIVVSNKTRDHYGRLKPQKYVDEVRGFYYSLTHSHVPVDFIAERDLEDKVLSKYRVVILANTAYMTSNAVKALEKYVENGGNIIATYLASSMNEEGIPLDSLQLSSILGVDYKGIIKAPWSYISIKDDSIYQGMEAKDILIGDMSYVFKDSRVEEDLGYHTIIEPVYDDVNIHATISLPNSEWGYEYTLGRSPPMIGYKTLAPAITSRTHGVGKAVYFTFQLGRHYWRTGLPVYRELIIHTIKFLDNNPPVRVEAPETLAVEAYRQDNRVIVHLLNHTYNQRIMAIGIGSTKQPLPPYSSNDTVHPPRVIIPLADIKIHVNVEDTKARYKVYSALTNREYEYSINGKYLTVNVDKVLEYEVIVVESRR